MKMPLRLPRLIHRMHDTLLLLPSSLAVHTRSTEKKRVSNRPPLPPKRPLFFKGNQEKGTRVHLYVHRLEGCGDGKKATAEHHEMPLHYGYAVPQRFILHLLPELVFTPASSICRGYYAYTHTLLLCLPPARRPLSQHKTCGAALSLTPSISISLITPI